MANTVHYTKRGDNRPLLLMTLLRDGQPVNLTGAVSARLLSKKGSEQTISQALTFQADRSLGEVFGTLSNAAGGVTNQAGTYKGEVELTWSGSGASAAIETFPNRGTFTIEVEQDLG